MHGTEPTRDMSLQEELQARAEQAWTVIPDDIRFAMRRRLFQMSPFQAIRAVGGHYRDEHWSITPFPDVSGFGELGLIGCTHIHAQLCKRGD